MYRRIGCEGATGIPLVSEESQRNLEIAEDLCRKGKIKKATPYLFMALLDGNNLDARIQNAFIQRDKKVMEEELKLAEIKGRKILKEHLGQNCFDDEGEHVGKFWAILETRPYMRVLNALVRFYVETKQYEESAEVIIEMLRLCPGDNLSNRTWLGTNLIRIGRYSDALFFAQTRLKEKAEPQVRGGTAFKAPRRELLSEDVKKRLVLAPGALLYSAAFASFKLWGDCPESRQYLALAAKVNPHVMLKILGKIPKPSNLNSEARVLNGPEDAHDYLWLSQDLWMEPDIWKWANNNPDVKKLVLKKCQKHDCSKTEEQVAQFKRCSLCHRVYYCSEQCQNTDWKKHKAECHLHKDQKKVLKAFQQGKPLPKGSKTQVMSADFSSSGMICLTDGSKIK